MNTGFCSSEMLIQFCQPTLRRIPESLRNWCFYLTAVNRRVVASNAESSQVPATDSYSKPDEFRRRPRVLFLWDSFTTVLPSVRSSACSIHVPLSVWVMLNILPSQGYLWLLQMCEDIQCFIEMLIYFAVLFCVFNDLSCIRYSVACSYS
jgi:hypothetical protein